MSHVTKIYKVKNIQSKRVDKGEAPGIHNVTKTGTTVNFYHCFFDNTDISNTKNNIGCCIRSVKLKAIAISGELNVGF